MFNKIKHSGYGKENDQSYQYSSIINIYHYCIVFILDNIWAQRTSKNHDWKEDYIYKNKKCINNL